MITSMLSSILDLSFHYEGDLGAKSHPGLTVPDRLFDHWALQGPIFLDFLTQNFRSIFASFFDSHFCGFLIDFNSIVVPFSVIFTSLWDHFFEHRFCIDFEILFMIVGTPNLYN